MRKTTHSRKRRQNRLKQGPLLDVTAYKGRWVAIHPETNKVIAHGMSLEEARRGAPNFEREEPVLYFVPVSDAYFIGPAV